MGMTTGSYLHLLQYSYSAAYPSVPLTGHDSSVYCGCCAQIAELGGRCLAERGEILWAADSLLHGDR